MSTQDVIIFTIAAIVFFIVAFVTHYCYQNYLWYVSVEHFVPWMQSFAWSPYKGFVRFLFWFGWEILWLIVIVFYSYFNRASSAFLLVGVSEVIAVICVLQMYWSHPCPYMKSAQISAIECDRNSFQNPALEVAIAAFAYSMMFYLAYDWIEVRRPRVKLPDAQRAAGDGQPVFEDDESEYFLHDESRYQRAKNNDFSYWVWLSLVIFIVFLVSYASIYIGSNSLDQVLFALTLGYGLFCVYYYYLKDFMCERATKISEKMIDLPKILISTVIHIVVVAIFLLASRYYYSVKNRDFVVNPEWINQHKISCGTLRYPSFYDKEMLYIYRFLYLDLGIVIGMALDAILLGGTRIDYNHPRKADNNVPVVGFLIRFLLTLGWIVLCCLVGSYYFEMLVHHKQFLHALPYFICGLGLTTFLKYIFHLLKATRAEIHPIPGTSAVELRRADQS